MKRNDGQAVLVCSTQETIVPALRALMITERSDTKNNLARSGNLRHGSYCFAELAAGQRGLFFPSQRQKAGAQVTFSQYVFSLRFPTSSEQMWGAEIINLGSW